MPTGLPVKTEMVMARRKISAWISCVLVLSGICQSAALAFWQPLSDALFQKRLSAREQNSPSQQSLQKDLLYYLTNLRKRPEEPRSREYLLLREGAPIGTVRVKHSRDEAGDAVTIESKNRFEREGESFETGWNTHFVEPVSHKEPIQFNYHSHLGMDDFMNISGEVDLQSQSMHIHPAILKTEPLTETTQQAQEKTIGLSPELPFVLPESEAQRKLFQTHSNDAPNTRFVFQTLELGTSPRLVTTRAMALSHSQCVALQRPELTDVLKHAVCFRLENPAEENSAVIEWRTAKGQLIHAKSLNDNTELVYALAGIESVPAVDLIRSTRIASNYIPHPRRVTHGQYRISLLPGKSVAAFNLLQLFPSDDRQKRMSELADSIELDVQSGAPSDAAQEYPFKADPAYLVDSPLVQSTDPEIIRIAKQVVENDARAYFAAQRLRRWVFRNVQHKNYDQGFSSALEVLDTRSGDCTEHAVLLAALLRSIGIPSRVAVGFIYMPSDTGNRATTGMGYWVYHLWTEALIGKRDGGQPVWASLDASQPEDMMDAAHLKLDDSALASIQDVERFSTLVSRLSGSVRIDVLDAFSPQESVYNLRKAEPPTIPTLSVSGVDDDGLPISAQAIPPKSIDLKSADTLAGTKAQEKEYRVAALPQTLVRGMPEGAFQAGVQALRKDQYATAVDAFEDAIMQHRTNPGALMSIGKRLFAIGMYREAAHAFDLASAGTQGRSLTWKSAMPWVANLSESNQAQYQHALYLAEQGNVPQAQSILDSLIAQQPSFAPAYGYLAKWRNDPSFYQRYQQYAPNDPQPDMALGEDFLQRKQYARAAQAFESAVLKINAQPDIWYGLQQEASAKADIASALDVLQQNRKNADAWYKLGKAYQNLTSLGQAGHAYQQALRYRPGFALANAGLLHLAISNNRWDKASAYASRLSGHSQPDAMTALGYYRMRQRDYAGAIALLRQAVDRDANLADAARYLSQAHMRRYDLYRNRSDWQQAFGALQEGISESGPETRKILQRAYIQTVLTPPMSIKEGNEPTSAYYGQALTYAARLVSDDWAFNDINSRIQQGRLLTLLGRYDDAKKTLEQVLDVYPYETDALAAMGYLSEMEESPLQAMAYYQRALKQEPDHFMAKQGLHTVMIEENLKLDRPRADWLVSPDEFDYLRQWMMQEAKWLKRQQILADKALPLLAHWGDITVKAQREREALWRILWGEEQWQKAAYQTLKSMPMPKRFDQFRFFALERKYTDIEWSMAQHAFLPNFTDVSMRQKRELMQEQFQKAVENMNATDKRYIGYINGQLPVTLSDWNRVMAAAGLGSVEHMAQLRTGAKSGLDEVNKKVADGLKSPTSSLGPSTTIITQPGKPTQVITH